MPSPLGRRGVVAVAAVAGVAAVPLVAGRPAGGWMLVGLAMLSAIVIADGARRHPAARPVWSAFAVAVAASATCQAITLGWWTPDDRLGHTRVAVILAGPSAVAALSLTLAIARLWRPLLSFGPCRARACWALAFAALGASSLLLTNPTAVPIHASRWLATATVLPAAIAVGSGIWFLLGCRPLVDLGRRLDLDLAAAYWVMLAMLPLPAVVDFDRYVGVPAVAGAVLVALASRQPVGAVAAIGTPVDGRPFVAELRWRWLSVEAMVMIAVVPALQGGAPLWVSALGVVLAIAASCAFARDLQIGARPRVQRPGRRIERLARALPGALIGGDLDLLFQPIVRVHDGALVGLEALLRWHHPELGPIPPPEIVATARWAGLHEALDIHVIERVATLLPMLLPCLPGDEPFVSVNVTPQTLQVPDFATRLLDRLALAGATADGLVLEIGEDGMVHDWPALAANAARLQDAGAQIALDDFGAGTANVTYLTEIELDYVKLDRSLLRLVTHEHRARVLRRVVDLVGATGALVIAEGVEDAEGLRVLHGLGVQLAQGYHLGRPAALADALRTATLSAHPD